MSKQIKKKKEVNSVVVKQRKEQEHNISFTTDVVITYKECFNDLNNSIKNYINNMLSKCYKHYKIDDFEFKINRYAIPCNVDMCSIPVTIFINKNQYTIPSLNDVIYEGSVRVINIPQADFSKVPQLFIESEHWFIRSPSNVSHVAYTNDSSSVSVITLVTNEIITNFTLPIKYKITNILSSTGFDKLECQGYIVP